MGTDKNCILEGSLQHKFSYIMWGHVGQVLAVAPHPSDTATFATGGANDRMVVKWRKQGLDSTEFLNSLFSKIFNFPALLVVAFFKSC